MLRVLVVICGALLIGCESAPIKVTQMPDVAAVTQQNESTKKHIHSFSDTNKKTQLHVRKVQDEAVQEADALDQVRKDLDRLLHP